MKSKHTPGPWTFSGQKGPVGICIKAQVWDSEGYNLSVMKSTEDPEEATANARLVAAAPDMLEALNEMVISFDILDIETDSLQREAIRNSKEAIKKAKGDE